MVPTPNVRLARDSLAALQEAYAAIAPPSLPSRVAAVERLTLSEGRVVVNMRQSTLRPMLEHRNRKYGNFWEDLLANNVAERAHDKVSKRMRVDSALFGPIAMQIRCASLSLDGSGASFYGEYAVTLEIGTVEHRLSLLEDNPFNVDETCLSKLRRADWDKRGMLAVVKWGQQAVGDPERPLMDIVQVRGAERDGQDFIEAHVWGSFTAAAFKSITIQEPRALTPWLEADFLRVEELAREIGIVVVRKAATS